MNRTVRNALAEIIRGGLHPPASGAPGAPDALDFLARVLASEHPVEMPRTAAAILGDLVTASPAGGARVHLVATPAVAAARAEAQERVRRGRDARRRLRRRATPAATPLAATLRRAAALFDARLYFEVHEELEIPWRGATGDTRRALQGLVQVAVGLHHDEAGNRESMRRLFASGRAKLEPYAPRWRGVDLAALLRDVDAYEAARERGGSPVPPRLVVA
ncbi:MAG TPA: DUF309 domain-containing protein [Candidatus Binatia bacterium]|jgi:hypothetical protein